LQAEAEAQAQVNPLVNDYGESLAEAKAKQDLINAAQKAGVELTPQVMAKIEAEAKEYGVATAALNQLNAEQEHLRKEMEDTRELGKDVLGGFIEDLENGKSATEALSDALKKLANTLLQSGLDQLFGISGQNNWFSSLFSSFFGGGGGGGSSVDPWLGMRAGGGPVRAGQAYIVGEKRPEVFVPDQDGTILPSVPKPFLGGGTTGTAGGITYAPTYNFQGTSQELADFRRQADRDRADFSSRVIQTIRKAKQSHMKLALS
jgi:hypothetical protein